MTSIGIFFGSDTGSTRKIAKAIQQKLGDKAAAPVNINKASVADLEGYDYLILGTPTLGEGQLPGLDAGCANESWGEFLPNLDGVDLSGKKVVLFGLGDQVSYANCFVDGLGLLYDSITACGAEVLVPWPTDGYDFKQSAALLDDDNFVGLVLDQDNQKDQSDSRLATWLALVESAFAGCAQPA